MRNMASVARLSVFALSCGVTGQAGDLAGSAPCATGFLV